MMHEYLIRAATKALIIPYQILSGTPYFENNPDYHGQLSLHSLMPQGESDFSSRATYAGYDDAILNCTWNDWEFVDTAPFYVSNKQIITFPACTADSAEILTHWAWSYLLYESPKPYRIVFAGVLSDPLVLVAGDVPVFPIHTLTAKIGDSIQE